MTDVSPILIGISLKMYFSQQRTLAWGRRVAQGMAELAAVSDGRVRPFILPSFPLISQVQTLFADTPMAVGAQNLHWDDEGAYTGEVSGALLAEMGATLVELGHAERRRIFHEDDEMVAAKTAAAIRNQLTPLLCVGEARQQAPADAAAHCIDQVWASLQTALPLPSHTRLVIAYEPMWAIGAERAAPIDYVRQVCELIRSAMRKAGIDVSVIYGGSAGPGLLGELGDSVDGLFLGRFCHDPNAFLQVLEEASQRYGKTHTEVDRHV